MTPDQRRIADRVGKAAKALGYFQGREATENERDPLFQRARNARDDAFTAAIRAGLLTNPLIRMVVEPWLDNLRGTGQRDKLRQVRRGLDTKVSRPIPMQLRPTAEDAKIIELHLKKISAQRIVDIMRLKISRQAVRKRLKKLGYA